jgi:cation:H+ antiporter
MGVFLSLILFIFGLTFLVVGTNIFLRAVTWFSDVTGVSRAVMGATVVAFATSAPEFFISIFATVKGYEGLSTGNIVGSNIVNLGIGFAIIAFFMPHKTNDRLFTVNGLILLAVTIGLFTACLTGAVSVLSASLLMAVFLFFTFINVKNSKSVKKDNVGKEPLRRRTNKKEATVNILFFALGMAGFIFGADMVTDSATAIATLAGVSDYIIGLTIVAIGTSLPEFTITIVSIIKKEKAICVGNLIGTNIFNIAFILSVAAFVGGGIAVTSTVAFIDLPIAITFALIAVVPTMLTKKVYRLQGIALFTLYIGYFAYIIIR